MKILAIQGIEFVHRCFIRPTGSVADPDPDGFDLFADPDPAPGFIIIEKKVRFEKYLRKSFY